MSFILDAIAKSERERQQQEVPDARILAMPTGDLQRPRRIIPFFVAGALLLNVIVILVWTQTDLFSLNQTSKPDNAALEPATTQITTTGKLKSQNEIAHVEMPGSTAQLNHIVESMDTKTPAALDKTFIQEPVTLTRIPAVSDQSPAGTKHIPPTLNKVIKDAVVVETESTPAAKMVKSDYSNSHQSVIIEPETPSGAIDRAELNDQTGDESAIPVAPRKITSLSELPADVRRDLPSISFTGHLFSKNVKLSYVMVDGGRSVIAGQQIVDDLFLHKVTPTGAIVEFRGYLIETGILQNWSLK